jgi:hypothetical protein
MATGDARPFPRKNAAYRVTFPILDADGDLVTGATGLDSEISKNGGTFADCTNEATEIATASGMYYLDLTAAEMNTDTVAIIVKTSSSGAKTTPIVLYPVEATDIDVNVTAWNGTAIPGVDTAGYPRVTIKDGTGAGEIDADAGKVKLADGAITSAVFDTGAIDSNSMAAALQNSLAESIAGGIWEINQFTHMTPGTMGGQLLEAANGNFIGGSFAAATNAARAFEGLVLGAALTGTLTATAFSTTLTEATNDHYNGRTLTFTSGPLAGQMTTILDYNGATKVVTVAAMTEAPANGNQFFIA